MSSDQTIEFFKHSLGPEEKARVLAALDETILTTGQAVAEAERALADYLNVAEVVCLDSCTAALHLALLAQDIGPGDEVVVPAMTFVATANAVLMAGATPVFADVDPSTGCITVDTVEPHISERTRAIIPVHLYGLLCDMERLSEYSRERKLILIEDSAHCMEARRGNVRPGSHSRAACFSFYATKSITCGEGGALATNDPALADRVRTLSLHGMSSSVCERYREGFCHWDMEELGWKYNLDNIRGSLLLPQILKLDTHCQRRRTIAAQYDEAFSDLGGVRTVEVAERNWSARHLYTILVDPSRRDDIVAGLHKRRIGAAINYRAVHLLTYFKRRFGFRRGDLPVAESLGDRTISLPLYPQLTGRQVQLVVEAVKDTITSTTAPTTCGGAASEQASPVSNALDVGNVSQRQSGPATCGGAASEKASPVSKDLDTGDASQEQSWPCHLGNVK